MDLATVALIAVLVFAVAFLYANLGLGGGILFVPILLSTGMTKSDVAVPISLTLTIATATPSVDRKSTRLNSSHIQKYRMPSSA